MANELILPGELTNVAVPFIEICGTVLSVEERQRQMELKELIQKLDNPVEGGLVSPKYHDNNKKVCDLFFYCVARLLENAGRHEFNFAEETLNSYTSAPEGFVFKIPPFKDKYTMSGDFFRVEAYKRGSRPQITYMGTDHRLFEYCGYELKLKLDSEDSRYTYDFFLSFHKMILCRDCEEFDFCPSSPLSVVVEQQVLESLYNQVLTAYAFDEDSQTRKVGQSMPKPTEYLKEKNWSEL